MTLTEPGFLGAISGGRVTGTEWEFEDALAAARQHNGVPDLLVYRKRARVPAFLDDDIKAQLDQKERLENFIARWLGSAEKQDITAATLDFRTDQEFEDELYRHLAELLERKAGSALEQSAIRYPGAPFRGLASFDLEHAPIFFGRTRARNELRELLARQRLLAARMGAIGVVDLSEITLFSEPIKRGSCTRQEAVQQMRQT